MLMPEPSLYLETIDDLRQALVDLSWDGKSYPSKWKVKSQWLIDLIEELSTDDFAYNSDVLREAEKRLGGYPDRTPAGYSQEGSPLSTLIYNAQRYRRSDKLKALGYQPMTQELIEEAFQRGRKIDMQGVVLSVKEKSGKRYAMKSRKRVWAVSPQGQPAKIV